MKRLFIVVILFMLPTLLLLSSGCGKAKTTDGQTNGDDSSHENGEVNQAQYELGHTQGLEDGYTLGYADGKKGVHSPDFEADPEDSKDYVAGYGDGFYEGYEKGYNEAQSIALDELKERAAVEKAMITFVQNNAAPGLEFEIQNLQIKGDEAVGIAVCTSEKLDSPLVIMKKGPNGWYGADLGTGIEPPSWYTY